MSSTGSRRQPRLREGSGGDGMSHSAIDTSDRLKIENKITQRKLSALMPLLFTCAIASPATAATLNLTTKYGDTGGNIGNLNAVGDTVNGRDICPAVNTYANATPGCDMSADPGYNDSGTGNPDDDSYTGDLVVRTNDVFNVVAAYSWLGNAGGAEESVTLTGTLPAGKGFIWESVPGGCDASSSISADGKTITCVRKNFDTNDVGSFAEDLPFPVRAEGDAANGSVPGDITFSIDDPTSSGPVSDGVRDGNDANLIKITAAPRWNIDKHGGAGYYTTSYGQTDDEDNPGWYLWYQFTIEVDEVDGESDTAGVNPKLGNEALQGGTNATVTFTDDLSQVSPNAKLVTWSTTSTFEPDPANPGFVKACDMDTYTNSDEPYPYLNATYPDRSIPTAAGAMGVTCAQTGSNVSVTVTGIDGTLTHAPVKNKVGGLLPVNRGIAAIGTMRVFVPLSDVVNAGGNLTTTNCLTDFTPTGISGGANFGGAEESEADNCRNILLVASGGSWDKNFRKGWSDRADQISQWGGGSWALPPTDASVVEAGDGTATPGSVWGTYTVYSNTGGSAIENPVLCDVIDVETYDMTILSDVDDPSTFVDDTKHAVDLNYGVTEATPGLTIEYATGYVGAWPPDPFEAPKTNAPDEVVNECSDPGITWYPDYVTAAANGAVSKVRISAPELPAGGYMAMRIKHTARSNFLTSGSPIPNDTILVNHASYKSSLTNNVYRAGDYYPNDASQNPANGGGGDRLIMVRAKARILKSMTPASVSPGSEASVKLTPSFTTEGPLPETDNVTIKDLLPKGLAYANGTTTGTYGAGATAYGEPVVISPVTDADCTTHVQGLIDEGYPCASFNSGTGKESILSWDLGNQATGTVFGDLEFNTVVSVDSPPGVLKNYAVIQSPGDSSEPSKRIANANVSNTIPSSLLIVKSVQTPIHEVNSGGLLNWMEFQVGLRNGSSTPLTDLDVIDILPFNGDGVSGSFTFTPQQGTTVPRLRVPATSYNGSFAFDSVSLDQNGGECNGTESYWFTNAAGPLDISPLHASNSNPDGSVTASWCQGTTAGPASSCGFDNAAVTAVRVRGAGMAASGTCFVNLKFATDDNRNDDIYANTAGAKATGVTNGVLSNTVSAIVYSSTIGDKVWRDTNENGLQDDGEPGIAGIVVKLLQSDGTTPVKDPANPANDYQVTTDASGHYLFDNLLAGDYVVKFELAGETATAQDAGDDALDSDVNASGITGTITLGENEDRLDVDAGIIPAPLAKGSIGNFVWDDVNANGIQDASEAGIAGVTVTLYDETGTAIGAPVVTDADGLYNFPDLDAGEYSVGFTTLPAGYQLTAQDQGGDDGKDSDVDASTGKTASITLAQGQNDPNWDAGLFKPASLGDFVWNDANSNGIQDANETGVENVSVALLDGSGNPVEDVSGNVITTTTDANGAYVFNNLIAGDYAVQFTALAGYTLSPQNQGADDAVDSDANSSGKTATVTLAAGDTNTTLDAGIYQASSLGDFVWKDVNANGVQDAGETGIENVTVTLLDGSGNPVEDGSGNAMTTQTDVNGAYQFSDLTPGIPYAVKFSPPSGYALSPQDQGDDDAADSDADSTGKTGSVTLAAGENNPTLDAGMYQSLTLGDYVWMDSDVNGVQDAGEAPVADITVNLYAADGTTLVDTAITDATGLYQFTDVIPGDYVVEFVAPANTRFTTADQGGDDALDSDVDVASGRVSVTAVSSQSDDSIDAGLIPAGVEGRVWIDNNAHNNTDDGSANEAGVVGVRVNLMSPGADGIVGNEDDVLTANTTTGQDGLYNFGGVLPGTYYVEFEEPEGMQFVQPDIGTGDTDDSDADLSTGRTPTFDLSSGETEIDLDAGVLPGELGDRVWLDVNGNNVQDAGEPGVAGITVKLLDSNGNPTGAESITDDNGFYSFNNLLPAVYGAVFEMADDMQLVTPDQGDDDSIDSDAAVDTNMATVTISSGTSNQTIDAGIVPAVIGDKVWFDSNGDGIQDAGEAGIEGVTVELMGSDGSTVVDSVTTDSEGLYHFSVVPGDYAVKVVAPAGSLLSAADQGGDDQLDADVDPETGLTPVISVASGEVDNRWDAGLSPAEISGHVIHDVNADGVENEGDRAMPVPTTVTLVGTDVFGNRVTETVTTDANGAYHFTVVPGRYTVTETDPENYHSTGSEAGTSGSQIDSDNSLNVTVNSGQHSENNDFLDNNAGGISGQVREDVDQDGDANDTDTGISGVTIQLLDDQGTVVATTQTDVSGHYTFTNVPPGDYTVQETDPSGYRSTADIEGANDNRITVTLPAGGNSTGNDYLDTVDTGVISGQVRLDGDADADVNDTDSGIAGVTIQLLDAQGTIVATTQTDAGGHYSFTNVLPGDYTVQEIDPDGHHSTGDVSDANDNSIAVTLPAGGSSTGNDYLDTLDTGVISGQVRLDDDGDADTRDTDNGIAGVSIELLDAQGTVVATTQTDADGHYSFTDVQPGDYSIRETDLNGYTSTGDVSGANDNTIAVTLPAGGSSVGNDYLDTVNTGVISGQVRFDSDGDGDTNDADAGISGVTIQLLNQQGQVIATTVTDSSGSYSFTDIPAGDYTVRENQKSIPVSLPAGGNSTGNDYLDDAPGTGVISGQVRLDSDGDGDINDADNGISGATITLLNDQGQVMTTTITDGGGRYSFIGLPPGDYVIRETDVNGYTSTGDSNGSNDNTIAVTLPDGGTSTGNDYLDIPPAVIREPSTGAQPIPTLSEWMLIMLSGLMAIMGWQVRRKQETD